MKALRLALVVVALVGMMVGPARAAQAKTGDGLNPPQIVHWLATAAEGKTSNWNSLFEYAYERLSTMNPSIAREVEEVVNRAEVARNLTPCSSEFLSHRIQEDLLQIANREAGSVVGVIGPSVCAVTFSPKTNGGHTMSEMPHADQLEIWGYNFGSPSGTPQVYVTHRMGVVTLTDEASVTYRTNLRVNLTDGIAPLCGLQDANLIVAWDDKGLYQTPIPAEWCAHSAG